MHSIAAFRIIAPFILGLWFIAPAPAHAGAADRLCTAAPEAIADRDALNRGADHIEAAIAAGTVQAVDLEIDTRPGTPAADAALARARYCIAAAEALRTAPWGSRAEAQYFLLFGLRQAEMAHDSVLAGIAAYRLGLTAATTSVAGGTRGARRLPAAAPPAESASPPPAESASADPCAIIIDPGFVRLPVRGQTRAALLCAAARARAGGNESLAALAELRLTRASLAAADRAPFAAQSLREEARASATAGLIDAGRIQAAGQRAMLLGRLAEVALDAGVEDQSAIVAAVQAMRSAQPAAADTLAAAAAIEGRLAMARGDMIAARRDFQRAIFIESTRPQPFRLTEWLLYLARAEPARHAELVTAAYRTLQSVRPLLPATDPLTEESTFANLMRPVFEAAVAVELGRPAGTDPVAQIDALQQIVEAYREAELQNAFGSNCVPSRDPVRPASLTGGETLLYPILLDDRVELIVSTGAGANAHYERLPIGERAGRREVARLVTDLVASMSEGGGDAWREPAARLYQLLIAPIEGRLTPGGTLVIVPDGPLRALPFAALVDAEGKYLIERTRLSIAPALAYSQPGRPRGDRKLDIVAAALEREVALPAGTFPKLDGTHDEAQAAVGPGGKVIENFHEADLRTALGQGHVDVLHLATHAAFNGRSDRSFIVANDEAIPIADLRGLIQNGRGRGDELLLLVLSACETAVGDDQASMGLAGAAVQSGAESAIASLWEVNDAGTLALMKGFYTRYRGGMGRAEALRGAQLELIKSGGDLADPQIWAAFTLLGGWR